MHILVNKSQHNTTDYLGNQSPPHNHLAQVCKGITTKTVDIDTNECISIRIVPTQEAKSGILQQMKGKQSPLKQRWKNISV
jgi:hypothetical protein